MKAMRHIAVSVLMAGIVLALMQHSFPAFAQTKDASDKALLGKADNSVADNQIPKYDGRWWLSLSPKEQDGFVSGYIDCYIYEYGGPDHYAVTSSTEYERLLTEYYQNDPSKQSLPIADAIHEFRVGPDDKAPGDEPPRFRHADFDGLYWEKMSVGDKAKQIGFIEGYLSCYTELTHSIGGVFAKTPREYADLISQWYRLTAKAGEIDEKCVKVADVLFRVR